MEEAKKVFEELITLYDVADMLENQGDVEEAVNVRIKLNIISKFMVKNFDI